MSSFVRILNAGLSLFGLAIVASDDLNALHKAYDDVYWKYRELRKDSYTWGDSEEFIRAYQEGR